MKKIDVVMKPNILSLLPAELEEIVVNRYHESAYRALQIFQWLYKPIKGFSEMQNIPKRLREELDTDFQFGIPEIIKQLNSSDSSKKILMKLADNNIIEAVVIPYEFGDSACISTQVGCKMACSFCASGRLGFVRDLEAGEIIGEILAIQQITGRRISSLSLMGIGEPLDNYENIVKFLQIVHHPKGENLGYRSISLSTIGIVPRIYELADLKLPIKLCISLHFPTDNQRSEIMPINRRYPIEALMKSVKYYAKLSDHQVSIEYLLIEGVNDQPVHANQLIELVKHLFCHIALIPVNKIETDIHAPNRAHVREFKKQLTDVGLRVTIRRGFGGDIAAACGQLRRSYNESI
ncbi:MAG: 23S rRNA (adenine(2503)-C(2))-methyltransferase RlmN [Candidatus Helarchaeota archaeon]|nr:23S rRNA (adenine(2503)-C(2))-methyltransferase RlmN [Candidatus Helarchaeota archaeon]